MDKRVIQLKAHDLHKQVWFRQNDLWPEDRPPLIDMLHPNEACRLLNISYEEHEELGKFGYRENKFEIAGIIDRQAKKIAVSNRFKRESIRFTAAHELGHWVLHTHKVMHRDRPINEKDSLNNNRPQIEIDADYFAACYLMPPKLLAEEFKKRFLNIPLHIDENTAFWLDQYDHNSLLYADEDSLDREICVSSCENFNGVPFDSLAGFFKVSKTAMAIRLKELNLVKWP